MCLTIWNAKICNDLITLYCKNNTCYLLYLSISDSWAHNQVVLHTNYQGQYNSGNSHFLNNSESYSLLGAAKRQRRTRTRTYIHTYTYTYLALGLLPCKHTDISATTHCWPHRGCHVPWTASSQRNTRWRTSRGHPESTTRWRQQHQIHQ